MTKTPAGNIPALMVVILAAGLLLALGWAEIDRSAALAAVEAQTAPEGQGPHQERDGLPGAPAISFIDSQTPTCYVLDFQRDVCQIGFNYLYVTAASSQYIISMSVRIDDRMRAYYSGFFQTYMHVPSDMNGKGFTVSCGQPGSGGNPYLGKGYSFTIRARETGGLSAANYGTVYCPPGPRKIHLPLLRKN
jgi:hypothetical protein